MRKQLAALQPKTTGHLRQAFVAMINLLDSGRVHFVARGPSENQSSITMAILLVDTGDASLDAAVARIDREPMMVGLTRTYGQEDVTFPIGPGRRISHTAVPPGGELTRSIAYVVRVRDGTTLTLFSSCREADTRFADIMATMAHSLSR